MGSDLLAKMVPAIEQMNWNGGRNWTDLGKRAYDIALDQIDSYRGDPQQLRQALQSLHGSDSLPLIYAGIAYALIAAARENDGSYAAEGLEAAMGWLEKAQEMEPDLVDINFIESLVYIYGNELENARLVLDYLRQVERHHYHLALSEAIYWQTMGDVAKAADWYDTASQEATTVPQRLRLTSRLADALMDAGELEQALEHYKKALHFDRENPLIWHKMAVILWRMEQYEECQRCNQQTLTLKRLPAAEKLAEALQKKLDDSGRMGKLFKR